ncbi:MAG TPA: 4-hydroxythreonine-4-phosphate dehydrogenase PdxA [Edaphocola sp.]|nr:4-hydroxythreonine-4-phosphate dehydrogenase PdxA [Edaphocola sp.]
MEKPIIGITTGDLNGIGLEIIIKIFSDSRMLEHCIPVIFASNKALNYYRRVVTDHNLNFNSIKSFQKLNPKQVNVFNCWEEEVPIHPGQMSEIAGKYAIRSLAVAAQCLKDGEIDAMVTAPIHKANTQLPNFQYTGHTPFLKDKFEAKDVLMILYSQGFRMALATEHIPISKVAETITPALLTNKLHLLEASLIRDFGIDKPKIAVLGLNPHCGDNGLIGPEDAEIIKPVVDQFQEKGYLVFGPYSADAFFAHRHDMKFDGVLAMYHDQGLVPFKSLAETGGVNFTAGLPVVRTSPDHGVAFDIAGQNLANPDSMREAIFEAISLLRNRASYDEYTANPLQRQQIARER